MGDALRIPRELDQGLRQGLVHLGRELDEDLPAQQSICRDKTRVKDTVTLQKLMALLKPL